jgi:hypothetical protein
LNPAYFVVCKSSFLLQVILQLLHADIWSCLCSNVFSPYQY